MYTRTATALLLLSAASVAEAADYVTAVEATNPLAYWRLNANNQPSTNGTYSTTYDNVTTSPAGTGAPIAAEPTNAAAAFDGTGPTSIVTTGLSGGVAGTGTLVAWVNLAALPSSFGGRILYVAGISQVGNDLDLQFESDNQLRFYTGSGENTAYAPTLSSLTNTWHMIAATYDGTGSANDFRNIYWDGVLGASATGDVNGAAKTNGFTIGYSPVFGNREFSGLLDEVAVWNRALSASEIAGLYAARLEPAAPGAVPEPTTWAMLMLGFGMVGAAARRRKGSAVLA